MASTMTMGLWVQEWIEVMAAYVKSVDPLHLLTVVVQCRLTPC